MQPIGSVGQWHVCSRHVEHSTIKLLGVYVYIILLLTGVPYVPIVLLLASSDSLLQCMVHLRCGSTRFIYITTLQKFCPRLEMNQDSPQCRHIIASWLFRPKEQLHNPQQTTLSPWVLCHTLHETNIGVILLSMLHRSISIAIVRARMLSTSARAVPQMTFSAADAQLRSEKVLQAFQSMAMEVR